MRPQVQSCPASSAARRKGGGHTHCCSALQASRQIQAARREVVLQVMGAGHLQKRVGAGGGSIGHGRLSVSRAA